MVFGPFRLDPVSGHLYGGAATVPLAPVASKRELLDAVWPGVFVGAAVLKVTVGEVRKALGDAAQSPPTSKRPTAGLPVHRAVPLRSRW